MMSLLVNILAFSTMVLFVLAVFDGFSNYKGQVKERLSEIIKMGERQDEEDELKKPFLERLIVPAYKNIGNYLGNLTPREIRNNIEIKITYAGNPWNMTFNSFVSLQAAIAVPLGLLVAILAWKGQIEGSRSVLLFILAFFAGVMLPYNMINTRALKRQKEIQKSLPDILDLLLVSVEAGLSFDMSLKRITEQSSGVLSKEITRALEEMRLGKPREEALRGIVRRTGVPDLSSFISAIIQAEQLGGNIANTLRIQATSMRQKRRQRAEEAAMKAPIKMLFPLVFFIFPTLFIVLLGPAFIRIMQTFTTL
jgi:tight adherence protein C